MPRTFEKFAEQIVYNYDMMIEKLNHCVAQGPAELANFLAWNADDMQKATVAMHELQAIKSRLEEAGEEGHDRMMAYIRSSAISLILREAEHSSLESSNRNRAMVQEFWKHACSSDGFIDLSPVTEWK